MAESTTPAHPLIGVAPQSSGYVSGAKGSKLYYEVYGSKGCSRYLVLLQGSLCKIPMNAHVIQRFNRLGYNVLLYDHRGVGRSSCPPALLPPTTRLLAADALAVVDGVLPDGAASPFFLLGYSLGGMVAQELLYDLVVKGQGSRVQGAFLTVTSAGSWMRWLAPVRWYVQRMGYSHIANFRDQADFEARFPRGFMNAAFGVKWLDSPAVGSAARKAAAAGAGGSGGAEGGAMTQRQRLMQEMWSPHWRDLMSLSAEEAVGATTNLTAYMSHYLQPSRAAVIRNAGLRLGVGVASADPLIPPAAQKALVGVLGAEEHSVGEGHMDHLVLEGVGLLAGGALATFGDSRC